MTCNSKVFIWSNEYPWTEMGIPEGVYQGVRYTGVGDLYTHSHRYWHLVMATEAGGTYPNGMLHVLIVLLCNKLFLLFHSRWQEHLWCSFASFQWWICYNQDCCVFSWTVLQSIIVYWLTQQIDWLDIFTHLAFFMQKKTFAVHVTFVK